MRVRIGMRALFAIPLRAICWAPWSKRHGRDAAAVKCSEGVCGGWSGRTRRSLSLLLAISLPLVRLLWWALLQATIIASRSWRSAASIGLARRAPFTDAVALETWAVSVRLVAPDPVGHRQEQECPEHCWQSVLFSKGWALISTPFSYSSTLRTKEVTYFKSTKLLF